MIRVILFTLLTIPGWCWPPQKTRPVDFLKIKRSPAIVQLNQQLRRYPSSPLVEFPAQSALPTSDVYRKEVIASTQKEETGKEHYSISGVTSGWWLPVGRNLVLGPHPSLGVILGTWRGRLLIEYEFDLRFNHTWHDYKVLYNDTLRTTRQFLGIFAGIHVGYGIVNFKSSTLYLLGGIAGDTFSSVKAYNSDDGSTGPVEFDSFNVNAGIGFQRFLKSGYWGVELLYNVVHYRNPGGTPLDGNGITLRFTHGRIRRTR